MDDHHLLYFEVYKRITFEDTSWFQSDNYSDYDYEYDYRDIINLEYEVDTDSDTGEEEELDIGCSPDGFHYLK